MSTCHDFNTSKGCQRSLCLFLHQTPPNVGVAAIRKGEKLKVPPVIQTVPPTQPKTSTSQIGNSSRRRGKSEKAAASPSDALPKLSNTIGNASVSREPVAKKSPQYPGPSSGTRGIVVAKGGAKKLSIVPKPSESTSLLKNGTPNTKVTASSKPLSSTPRRPTFPPPRAANDAVGGAGQTKKSHRSSTPLTSPPGTCRLFYNFGKCTRTDKCKFRHVAREKSATNGRSCAGSGRKQTTRAYDEKSENISGVEALRYLTKYCSPDVTFSKPFQMMSFAKLLARAGPRNRDWDTRDAQAFLQMLTGDQGRSRLEYVLTYPMVVPCVQNQQESISFTATYLGCLSYFVNGVALYHNLPEISSLYGLLHAHFKQFHENVTTCMDDMVSRRSFEDPPRKAASGLSIFDTLVGVLTAYLKYVKGASRDNYPAFLTLEASIKEWFAAWKAGGFVDGWAPENEQTRRNAIVGLQARLTSLSRMIHLGNSAVSPQDTSSRSVVTGSLRLGFASGTLPSLSRRTYPRYRPSWMGISDDDTE